MANTILHETAHQKQHVKKGEDEMVDSDGDGTLDAPMEMGERLSIDIFGGHIGYFPDRGVLMSRDTDGDGRPDTEDEAVDDATIRNWLDCDRWRRGVNSLGSTRVASQAGDSGLEITISTIKQEFSDEEPIIVDVTLSNGGTSPIKVLPGIFGIHYPLAFVIENEQGEFAEWQGPIRHMSFSDDAYRTLDPGESLNISYDLRYDENAEKWRYDLFTWGTYTITAFYSQFVLPFDSVKSNEITITVKNSPHVRVTANPRWGSPPLTVTLDASESYDPDGTIVRHEWDFEGDGVFDLDSGTSPTVQHTYNEIDVYEVTVRLTDNDGYTSTGSTHVFVGAAPEWMMFRRDWTHKGRSLARGPSSASVEWRTELEQNWSGMSSPVIDLDGTVYAGAGSTLFAVNPSGSIRWQTQFPGYLTSPAVGVDGTIYVGCEDNNFYAVRPDGSIRWTFPTGAMVVSSPTVGIDGTIYFGGSDGWLYALNPDRTLKWKFENNGPFPAYKFRASPAIATDKTICIGSNSFNFYAVNPDGTLKWVFDANAHIYSSAAIADDGTIYFGTRSWDSPSGRGRVYALNPDGSLKWVFDEIGSFEVFASPAIGPDGTIYVGATDDIFYAINLDGSLKWSFTTHGDIYGSAAVGGDGSIYFCSYFGDFYALKPDGTALWHMPSAGSMEVSEPAIASDGSLYFVTQDGTLYKVKDWIP